MLSPGSLKESLHVIIRVQIVVHNIAVSMQTVRGVVQVSNVKWPFLASVEYIHTLTLLGLYLNTFIIRHELTLQKELQTFMWIFILYRTNNTTTKQKSIHKNQWIEPGTSRTPVWSVTLRPPRQPRQPNVSIEIKIFNSFNVMGQNMHKHCQICGPHFFNKVVFVCNILTCMDNYIWQFLMFTGVGFTTLA